MASKCEMCGKGPSWGMSVSHSHRRTKRRWNPNIQRVRAQVNGLDKARQRLHRLHQVRQESLRPAESVTAPCKASSRPTTRRPVTVSSCAIPICEDYELAGNALEGSLSACCAKASVWFSSWMMPVSYPAQPRLRGRHENPRPLTRRRPQRSRSAPALALNPGAGIVCIVGTTPRRSPHAKLCHRRSLTLAWPPRSPSRPGPTPRCHVSSLRGDRVYFRYRIERWGMAIADRSR